MFRASTFVIALSLAGCGGIDNGVDCMVFNTRPGARGEWVNNPQWGSGYCGPLPGAEGKELPILSFETGTGAPQVHSVNLYSSENVGTTNADVRAKVRFGSGAFRGEFLADWFNGQQFALVADSIRITAITYSPSTGSAYSSPASDINIGATVTAGDINQQFPLTYTEVARNFNDTEERTYEIPAYAKALMVHIGGNVDSSTLTNITLSFITAGSPLASIYTLTYDAVIFASSPNGIILPAGIVGLVIKNSSGELKVIRPQWILAI